MMECGSGDISLFLSASSAYSFPARSNLQSKEGFYGELRMQYDPEEKVCNSTPLCFNLWVNLRMFTEAMFVEMGRWPEARLA